MRYPGKTTPTIHLLLWVTGWILPFLANSGFASGQMRMRRFPIQDFSGVILEGVNGNVEIEVGQPYQVKMGIGTGDLYLEIEKYRGQIRIRPKAGAKTDKQTFPPVIIRISLPELDSLTNHSNADVRVQHLAGKAFFLENKGNGNVNSRTLKTKTASIHKTGNGDVAIQTDSEFEVRMAGNGDVVNVGKGKARILAKTGNGKVVYRAPRYGWGTVGQ